MPDEDIEQQQAIAAAFISAIAAIEQHLTVENGTLSVPEIDPAAENLDADAVQQLLASLDEANSEINSGELALADIGMKGDANA
jgi:hypothetical protein